MEARPDRSRLLSDERHNHLEQPENVHGTHQDIEDCHDGVTMVVSASKNSPKATSEVEISIGQRMLSATLGSIIMSLLVTPLDVVRVRLQSQTATVQSTSKLTAHTISTFKSLPANLGVTACCREVFWVGDNLGMCLVSPSTTSRGPGAAIDCAVEGTRQHAFTSTFDGLRKIARNEGLTSLWRGLSPTLIMAIPANVIYLSGYDWLRTDARSPVRQFVSDSYTPLVAGSGARIAAATVISPLEMFRTRLQATSGSGTGHFRETLKGLYQMTQTQGYGALWRGLTLTIWRDAPFSGFYWWGYEVIRNFLLDFRESRRSGRRLTLTTELLRNPQALRAQQDSKSTFVDSFIAGSTAGAAAALITQPFDVGKTRQQVVRYSGDAPSTAAPGTIGRSSASGVVPEQLPMPKFLLHIFREEGLSGLFKGWLPRCLKVAPACAIMISSYEIGKKLARDVNRRREMQSEKGGV